MRAEKEHRHLLSALHVSSLTGLVISCKSMASLVNIIRDSLIHCLNLDNKLAILSLYLEMRYQIIVYNAETLPKKYTKHISEMETRHQERDYLMETR